MGSQGISIVIQLISTVVLARLLTPEDYGVIAMVMAVTAFAGLFRDLGLSAAAIQRRSLPHSLQSNLFWLNVAMGAFLTGIVAACAPLVARFYGRPELTAVTLALSVTFLVSSLGTQHSARLVREMQFGRKAVASIGGALVGLVISITLALHGYSYWALVLGNLAGTVVATVLLYVFAPFWPGLPTLGTGIRDMLKFGANITAFDFVNYFHRNLDNVLIGRFWGVEALGLYGRAYALLMFPVNAIRGPINAVAFPGMSRLQDHPEAFRNYYVKVTSVVALLTMPTTVFLYGHSERIIRLMLGEQWVGSAPIFSWLALAAFSQPVAGLSGSLLLSLGRGSRYLHCGLFNALVLSACFVIGISWGPIGVAMAYAIGNYVILYPWLKWALKDSPVQPKDVVRAAAYPAVASVVSLVGSRLIVSISHDGGGVIAVGIAFFIYSLVFITALSVTRRGRAVVVDFLSLINSFRGPKRKDDSY